MERAAGPRSEGSIETKSPRSAKRTGVLLINLGTPDSPRVGDVRRYLTEFLNDPRVIDISPLMRFLLVNLIIVPFRAPKSAKVYRELFEMNGGVSPLLVHGRRLQSALAERLSGENVTVELAMRYGRPSLDEVCARMGKAVYDRVIILPLFPQYASASTGSALEKAFRLIKEWYVIPEVVAITQFFDRPGFVDTVVDRARKYDVSSYDHILFSYHGLPMRQIDKTYENRNCPDCDCDRVIHEENRFCYRAACYATTRLIAEKLDLNPADYTVCFQSRLDKKWLEPFSDKVVEERARKGDKKLLVFSPAFIADCLETTIEIAEEYKEIFEGMGGEVLDMVESLNDHPLWIDAVEEMVREKM